MKKISLLIAAGVFSIVTFVACEEEVDPCGEWWLDLTLDEGTEFLDLDGDGTPDGMTYIMGGDSITILCADTDLDADCIPDCYEAFMTGIPDDDGEDDGMEDGEEHGMEEGEDDGEVDPCGYWWFGLVWADGAELVDGDGDGTPDALNYEDGDDTISIVCIEDLDENCIPDCYQDLIIE